MIQPDSPRGILLDIEGTTSSISFVYDVMFPFVRRELAGFLAEHWDDAELVAVRDQIARDAGQESFARWAKTFGATSPIQQRDLISAEVLRLMDGDVKATGLKQLQGVIWKQGFDSSELKAHVYDDVPPALNRWNEAGRDVRIYSSGSIQAQKLFFGHTVAGDLLPLLRGHYDTTTGPKRESASYTKISGDFGLSPGEILFVSDVVQELAAARQAGMKTALAIRPGNPVQENADEHRRVHSFAEMA